MAKTQTTGRGGSSFIAAGVAILTVALFLGWLSTRTPEETVAVTEPGGQTNSSTDTADGMVVAAEELTESARVSELRGQTIRIDEVEVVTALGQQLFWLQLPGGMPFLAKLSAALVEQGTTAPSSGYFQIVGVIQEKSNAVLDEWESTGVFRNADDRLQAEYGSSYIEARRLTPASR